MILCILVLPLLFSFVCLTSADMKKEIATENLETCLDHKGKVVSHGDRFFPLGSDPCTQCTCRNGKPETCISVFCSPPENCRQYHALSDKCCEFVCLDRDFPNKGSGNSSYPDPDSLNTTNLGLRLVASTVTSFLILALLLFMIHRLRQRRLLLMIRRFHARRMDNGTAHLSRRYSEDDDGSVGYFVGHDHLDFSRYDEPPPPYTLWKPTEMYIPPGEAPPPYDLSVQLTAPFSGNRRYNLSNSNTVSRENAQVQQSAPAPTAQANVTITTAQVLPVTNQTVVEPQLEQQPVTSTSSGQNHELLNESESITYVRDRIVLPPDLQYEESNNFTPNMAVVSQEVENVNDEVASPTLQSAASFTPNPEEASTSATCCTCNEIETDVKSFSKRHSCSEFADPAGGQLKSTTTRCRRDKRLSLGSVNQNQNNNIYPDPTIWNGEGSESSSSSSPTYEQPTPSPSTSDSSFADTEYSRHPKGEFVRHCYVTSPFPEDSSISPRSSSHGFHKTRDGVDDDNRTPAFQKTLSNLKRFSLIKRKRKKRLEEKAVEISCSLVCQSVSDAVVLSPQPLPHLSRSEIPIGSKSVDEQSTRPLEAINPHIGHKLASSGIRRPRPTTVSVSGEVYRPHGGGRHSSFYGPLYTPDNPSVPLSTVVAIHHRPKTKSNRNHAGRASACSDSRSVAPQKQVGTSNESPSSHSGNKITRSGSICSETGERRYHKSSLSSPGTSHSRHLNEDPEPQNQPHESQYLQHVCVTNESHAYRVEPPQSLQNAHIPEADDTMRTLPVWIVNSESVLPRQEYRVECNPSGILSRCLSTGQIGESSTDSAFANNLHPALQIRDPSMCDSSWEACSHL